MTVCGSDATISLSVNSFISKVWITFWGHENCGKCSWYENSFRGEFFIQVCSSVSDNKQGSTVLSQSWFFVQCRLSPCSNLGYLAVITLAHCHSYCCCRGACFLEVLSAFVLTTIYTYTCWSVLRAEPTRRGVDFASSRAWRTFRVTSRLNHGWTSSGRFIWGGTCCTHVPHKDTGVYGGIPRLQGNKLM